MARYPAATWQPVRRYQPGVSGSIATRMAAHRRYGLHTAVSSAESLYNYFSVAGRATSHFYVSASGRVYQYIDTAYRSTAHLQGNPDTITVETQDMGGPFPSWNTNTGNVPAWTAAQVEALAKLGAWLHKTHGIRIQMCPNSRPGSLGFAWHRQGIDGNFPSGLLSGRVSGGELWSNARGKSCPGDRRIQQVQSIVNRAKTLAGGPTQPPTGSWFDMATQADLEAALKKVFKEQLSVSGLVANTLPDAWNTSLFYLAGYAAMAASPTGRDRQAKDTWGFHFARVGPDGKLASDTTAAQTHLRWTRHAAEMTRAEQAQLSEKVDLLIAAHQGLDHATIADLLERHHVERSQALEALATRLDALESGQDEMRGVLAEALSGERDAMDTLRVLAGILSAAAGEDDDDA